MFAEYVKNGATEGFSYKAALDQDSLDAQHLHYRTKYWVPHLGLSHILRQAAR